MRVVFLGTRQASLLCNLYRGLRGADDEIAFIDTATKVLPPDEERLAKADIIAWQETGVRLGLDLDEIGAAAERVRFPELSLDFLWPFGGQPHLYNTSDALFAEGPFPLELGDAWLNRRLRGLEQERAIEAAYLSLDVAAIVDLDAFLEMTLERQAEIDRGCGADYASRFAEEFSQAPLFANPVRPSDELLRDLADRLFERLRPGLRLPTDWRSEPTPELPLHPSLTAHFGLGWASEGRYRTWSEERIDFAEYVRRYLAYAEGPELETGVRLAALGRSAEALAPLERATGRLAGRRSFSAQRALARAYTASSHGVEALAALERARALDPVGLEGDLTSAVVLNAQARWPEAEAETSAYLTRTPDSREGWLLLAQIREKRGDGGGRVAALREGLKTLPDEVGLMSRLTLALAALGDWTGAISSAEREVAQDPYNPHSLAFLSAMLERVGDTRRAQAHLDRALEIISARPEFAELRNQLMKRQIAGEKAAKTPPLAAQAD